MMYYINIITIFSSEGPVVKKSVTLKGLISFEMR